MKLAGRSAIVTGGVGGLGAATVERLAGCEMRVVVLDRAGPTFAAGELIGEMGGAGTEPHRVECFVHPP